MTGSLRLGIGLVAAGARLYGLDAKPLWLDEDLVTQEQIRAEAPEGIWTFSSAAYPHDSRRGFAGDNPHGRSVHKRERLTADGNPN